MKNKDVSSPLFDIYSWVGKACVALWPLFLADFFFLIIQYITLIICLALLFGPFALRNADRINEGLANPTHFDWTPVLIDWISMAGDIGWVLLGCGLVLFYLFWYCLLLAIWEGGLFRTFWNYFEKGEVFSWGKFFQEAMKWNVPMLWMQLYLSLWGALAFLIWAVLAGVIYGFLSFFGFHQAFMQLVHSIPSGGGEVFSGFTGSDGATLTVGILLLGAFSALFWLPFGIGYTLFSFLAKAYLVQGHRVREAALLALQKFKADRWRVGLGLLVAFLVYFGVSVFVRMVLGVLSLIPILGGLFHLVDMLAGLFLTILMVVYLAGLSVAYLQDEAKV